MLGSSILLASGILSENKMGKELVLSIYILATVANMCLAATTTTTAAPPPPTTTTAAPPTTTTAAPTTTLLDKTTTAYIGPEVEYRCTTAGDNLITLILTVLDTELTRQIVATDITTDTIEFGDCFSTKVEQYGGEAIHTLEITFTTAGVQKAPSKKQCYIRYNNDNTLSVQVALQRDPPRISGGDQIRIATCDPTTLSATEIKVGEQDVNLLPGFLPDQEQAVLETELGNITATLVNVNVNDGTYSIGDQVYVKIEYEYALPQSPSIPIALYMKNLVAYGTLSKLEDSIEYVTDSGCVNEDNNEITDSFRITGHDPTNGITTSESGYFFLKSFRGSKKVILTLGFDASCYTIEGSACSDQQDYCNWNGNKRRRRSADSSSLNGNLHLEIPVQLPKLSSGGTLGAQNPVANGNTGVVPETGCTVSSSMYWVLAIVLGALLLVVIAICLFLILRLRNGREREAKIIDKIEGHKNSSYY